MLVYLSTVALLSVTSSGMDNSGVGWSLLDHVTEALVGLAITAAHHCDKFWCVCVCVVGF